MKKIAKIFVVLSFAAVAAISAQADSVTGSNTRPTGTDTLDWGQLGPSFTNVGSSFTVTSTGGVGAQGTLTGNGEAREQNNGWNGNFSPTDNLLWTQGSGPLSLDFGVGLSEVGAQIQSDYFGAFTAELCDNLGDCSTEQGTSSSTGDGSAIYIGLVDSTGANITSVTFSLTSCPYACSDFAIDALSLETGGPTPTPEPNSLFLLGTGLLVSMAVLGRRKLAV
jgi:hypothetical protein